MRLIPRSILGRLLAGTIITQLVVFACFVYFGVRKELRETNLHNARRLEQQTGILAGLSGEALAEHDESQVHSVFRGVALTQTLLGARLTDKNGTTLDVSNPALGPHLSAAERGVLFDLRIHPGYRVLDLGPQEQVSVLPFSNGGTEGIVWLYPNERVSSRLPRSVLEYGGLYGICALIGNLLLMWVLSIHIARPLRRIRTASLGVVGNPDDLSTFPLPHRGRGETAELTQGVNAMVAEIRRQRTSAQDTLALLDTMLRNAPVGFAFFDQNLRYVRVNQAMADSNGMPIATHLGRHVSELVPAGGSPQIAAQREQEVRKVFESGHILHDVEVMGDVQSTGSSQQVWLDTYYPVRTGAGAVQWVGVIARDITERRRADEALRRSEKLAAAGRLAASIAHEINNPLESVTNLLYLLQVAEEMPEDARGYVQLAQQELARVSEITQQTLRFYRQSSAALDTRLDDVLRSVLVLHQGKLHAAQIQVVRRADDSLVLFAYTGELRQLFANLIGNAIDAMQAGGGRLHLRVRKGQRKDETGIWVTVADTGSGMTPDVQRRIFEPFFTTKEATGTGLGLWVSTEILQKHRGFVKVRSRASVPATVQIALVRPSRTTGTVFRIFFPYNGVPRGPVVVRTGTSIRSATQSVA